MAQSPLSDYLLDFRRVGIMTDLKLIFQNSGIRIRYTVIQHLFE